MGRYTYSNYGRKDIPWTPDGDPMFTGIDMLHDRGSLAPGKLARCENKRLRDGVAATRPGTEYPQDFNPAFTNILSGSAIFRNPNGDEMMLIAEENASFIWALQFGKDPLKVALATGTTTNKFIVFTQAFNQVVMMRRPVGSDHMMRWDGDTTSTMTPGFTDSSFENMPSPTPDDPGITAVPDSWNAEPFENRLIYYNDYFPVLPGRDQAIVSDVLNFTAYDNFLGVFRINAGEADFITRIKGYFKSAIIIFKSQSIHLLQNFELDFLQAAQRAVTARLGSSGRFMPLEIGSRVAFLSQPGGFYFVDEVIQDQIASDPVPFSRPIQPVIDRINWPRQDVWGCSANVGDYSYFGLCLDQLSGGCDSIVVRNNSTGEWESAPDSFDDPNFRIFALWSTLYDGQRRLFGLDYLNKRVQLMYTGLSDDINDGDPVPVKDVIETRGYTCGDPSSFKRFERAVIGVRTLGPNATVTSIVDGYNEEKDLGDIVKSNLKFYTFAHPPFVPASGDANEPMREDYGTGVENFVGQDFELLPDGDLPYPYTLPGTPIDDFQGPKQQSLERMQIRQNGRWCSLRIANTGGQCDVLGVQVEAIPIQETLKVIA